MGRNDFDAGKSNFEAHWKGVGPENQNFFGPWNGNEQSKCHLSPKNIHKIFNQSGNEFEFENMVVIGNKIFIILSVVHKICYLGENLLNPLFFFTFSSGCTSLNHGSNSYNNIWILNSEEHICIQIPNTNSNFIRTSNFASIFSFRVVSMYIIPVRRYTRRGGHGCRAEMERPRLEFWDRRTRRWFQTSTRSDASRLIR